MRILYLADIRFPLERANGIQTIETCHALAGRGHAVRLVVRPDTAERPRDPFAFYELAADPRLSIERVSVFGSAAARRLGYLASALTKTAAGRGSVDIVMTRDLGVASALLGLPRVARPPIVYESHGYAPVFAETMPEMVSGAATAPASKLRRLRAREARVWRLADGYVTITRGVADELVERFGPRRALAVVPDGVRLSPARRFVPPGVPSTTGVVTYAGHLYPWKGVDTLLHALALLLNARAVIVGGHPAERDLDRLNALAQTLHVAERVTFTGLVARSEVTKYLEKSDVLVMPHTSTRVSERYASPLKLFEYMAAGKPIVASDLPAVREVLRDGENALLVKPGDAASLASGITRVLDMPELARQLAQRAFDEAGAYTWDRRAERLEQLFDEVRRP